MTGPYNFGFGAVRARHSSPALALQIAQRRKDRDEQQDDERDHADCEDVEANREPWPSPGREEPEYDAGKRQNE
jgi:hypothetical protein